MTFDAIDAWWWPYVFITVAGWMTTDSFRYLGVYLGGRISEESDLMVFVRAIATAFVAAVIGNLIVFPNGELGATPLLLRIGAVAAGFAAFLLLRRSILAGILAAEAILAGGMLVGL